MGLFGTTVQLNKKVSAQELEDILKKVAKDMGWKGERKEKYEKQYRLGSLHEEKALSWTTFIIRSEHLPLFEISGLYDFTDGHKHKTYPIQEITVRRGWFDGGFATRGMLERYLTKVGDYLSQQ